MLQVILRTSLLVWICYTPECRLVHDMYRAMLCGLVGLATYLCLCGPGCALISWFVTFRLSCLVHWTVRSLCYMLDCCSFHFGGVVLCCTSLLYLCRIFLWIGLIILYEHSPSTQQAESSLVLLVDGGIALLVR
ncbi:hypothetical protein KP509_28G005400 [Ceratopteris richardii]|uniref:Uncharacterized protein n=1 Tax=Ceratopteris richardii TaxID=49495 RepID=A0A8T2R973_CERRI|nr:hypothetical protein KP509_28G005400 [Ceratopteris richardii]